MIIGLSLFGWWVSGLVCVATVLHKEGSDLTVGDIPRWAVTGTLGPLVLLIGSGKVAILKGKKRDE